jgi:hypothetical protein
MKVLFSLVLLALISCGGGTGGSGVQSPVQYTYGTGNGYENLDKFKAAVANNQWAQNPNFARYNYYKFNYRSPSTAGCTKVGSGIFSFSYCLNQGTATPTWVTEEKKGVITNPLIPLSTIKDIVNRSVLYNPYTQINTTVPNAYFDGTQWIIVIGTESFAFNPGYPLGANPTYYKNTNGSKEYSLANYEYSFIQ